MLNPMSQSTIIKFNFATALTCVLVLLGWGIDRGITAQKLNTILDYVTESRAKTDEAVKEAARTRDRVSVLETKIDHILRAHQ